jgi:PAS domain S-box-containing protein
MDDMEHLNPREVARLLSLVETERRYYQEIVASIPVGLLIVSSDLHVSSSNRELRKIFGLGSGDRMQGNIQQFLPQWVLDKVREVMATGTPQIKIPVAVPGEPELVLRVSIRPIRNWDDASLQEALLTIEAGNGAGPVSHGTELDETPLPVAGLLDSLDAIIWAVELPGKNFLYVNEKAEELLGFPPEKWLETPTFWADRIFVEDRDWMLRGYDQSIETWARHHCEYRANTSRGRPVWLRESARILQDDAGQARHLIGFAVDVTQQRLLDGQYVQGQRVEAASRLANRAAHEIANQVMVISGYAEDLLATLDADSPLRADVREISAATNRLRTLMEQLSSSAKAQPLSADPIDLNDFLKKLEPHLQANPAVSRRLELKLFPAPIAVRAQSVELRQTILALIERARRASPEGGTITIECAPEEVEGLLGRPEPTLRPGVYAVISIEDEGATLDAPTRASLFEPTIQTSAGVSTEPALAQVYQWVRQWGGDLAVSPRAPRGSIFQIYLPRVGEFVEPPPAELAAAAPELPLQPLVAPADTGKTLLVVSEESGIRTLLSKMLRRENYRVLEAMGLEDALKQVSEAGAKLNLVIADASLPHMTESQSIARLKQSSPDVKLLFLTDVGETEELKALPDGAEYLQKPFTLKALVGKAKELLS